MTTTWWYAWFINLVVIVHLCLTFREPNSNRALNGSHLCCTALTTRVSLRAAEWPVTSVLIIERKAVAPVLVAQVPCYVAICLAFEFAHVFIRSYIQYFLSARNVLDPENEVRRA